MLNTDVLEGQAVSVSYRTADVLLNVHSGKRLVLMLVESQSLYKKGKDSLHLKIVYFVMVNQFLKKTVELNSLIQ